MSEETPAPKGRLISVSNRLPVVLGREEDGRWSIEEGMGGLVTALVPVLKDRGGLWIGWPGVVTEDRVDDLQGLLDSASEKFGYDLHPVLFTAEERANFYYGFANEIIWPIFHDLQTLCNFDPGYWKAYCGVNRKFAEVIAHHHEKEDYIWVHDYHLMKVAEELESLGVESSFGFYLHIPFPSLDIYLKLPWRMEIMRALLHYDLLGFQTLRDRRNFVQCIEAIIPDARIEGDGQVIDVRVGPRPVRVGAFPISIDFHEFARQAATEEVSRRGWGIHESLPDRKIILGVDRLDYTKGIPYRFNAFRNALQRYPELHRKVSLVQIVVPSRGGIPEYGELKTEIEQLVGEINGEYTESGWVPLHYIFRSLERPELLAYYRCAEVALITPLKDGMNLVAKEYCACNLEESGVLILSEFAGAAAQLQDGAILVNPYHIEAVGDAIYEAVNMDRSERRRRMRSLRETIRQHDIYWWVDSFLDAAISKDLSHFPLLRDYVPQLDLGAADGEG